MSPLEAALAYAARGWSIIPIRPGSKRAAVRWRLFQDLRPSQKHLRKWFGKHPEWQVAVVTGSVSGSLAIRDFDDLGDYEEWAQANPQAATDLPTVATGRGRHVYFQARDLRHRKLPGGEYRGDGHYTLLPPSIHPNGTPYSWQVELPEGELPMVDAVAAGLLPPEPVPERQVETSGPGQGPPDRPSIMWPPSGLTQRTRRFLKVGAVWPRRNDELFCAACDMASKGIDRTEAQRRLLDACGRCRPPYPASAARGTIRSAYSKPRWQARSADDPLGPYVIPRCIAQRRDLTAADKVVWAALDYRQRDKADCWPSLARIAEDTGVSRATVCESVKRLEGKGLLEVRRKYGQVNRYTTHLPSVSTRTEALLSPGEHPGPVQKPDTNTSREVRMRERPTDRHSRAGPEKAGKKRWKSGEKLYFSLDS